MGNPAVKQAAAGYDHESTYPYAFEKDGWHLVHESLKADMRLFAEALVVLQRQLDEGRPLEQWQADGVRAFWNQFTENVVQHHAHEEDYFFPWMASRMELPEKVAADHKQILGWQDEITLIVKKLGGSQDVGVTKALVTEAQAKFAPYQSSMEEHFVEEERDLAPLMRKAFPYKEYQATAKKMVRAMGPYELPSLLYNLPAADQKAFMTQEGIPGFVQALIIKPKLRKYDQLFMKPIEGVVAGTPLPPPKKGFFSFFSS